YTIHTSTGANSSRSIVRPSGIDRTSRPPKTPSVLGEIILQLPRRDLGNVLLPLEPLRRQKLGGDMLAERFPDHFILFQLITGLLEIALQIIDSEPPLLA